MTSVPSPGPAGPTTAGDEPATTNVTTDSADPLRQRLRRQLTDLLGPLPAHTLAPLEQALEWVTLPAGAVLMQQDEPGDAMFLVVSGRLRAWQRDADGGEQVLRDMGPGEFIGEISLYTGAPRTATVAAVRSSVVARLAAADFHALVHTLPALSAAMTRQVIARLRLQEGPPRTDRPVTLALVPVTAGVEIAGFATQLEAALRRHGPVSRIDASGMAAVLGEPGLGGQDAHDPGETGLPQRLAAHLAAHLDRLETEHAQVLLVADPTATAWTGLCCQHADEVLLVADADQPSTLHASEQAFLAKRDTRTRAAEVLVLLHPPGRRSPQGTGAWLAGRQVADHVHLRRDDAADMARLARIQARQAVGLVLAGGGARGLSHLGVWQALRRHGIEPDFFGGASIGAAMAAIVASGRPEEEVLRVARQTFKGNPTSDYAPWPLLSLIGGQRLRRVVQHALQQLTGHTPDIADLWRNAFVITSNYSAARETVMEHGDLARALRASVAIPGALPPVLINGELHCDGGSFNNLPVDVMRQRRGVGHVIAVDLGLGTARRYAMDEVPGPWALLWDRLRPRRQRRYRFPSLAAYLLNTSILYSSSRQRRAEQLTDLLLRPALSRVGMLHWHRFDEIVGKGRAQAEEMLARTPEEQLAPLRTRPD